MSRFLVSATWDDNAPHLTKQAKADLHASIPPYQRDAREKGIPQLGAGVILPFPDEEIVVDAFPIPDHWPRGYGLDIGWNKVAALWDAKDPDTGTIYRYDEHYSGEQHPVIHGEAMRRRGAWIPGRIDPAAHGRSQVDGKKLMTVWRQAIYGTEDVTLGMRLLGPAVNAVSAGLDMEYMALSTGLLKVMRHRCPNWMAERRLYRRDERGHIVKQHDHAIDAGRYRTASGDLWLAVKPAEVRPNPMQRFASGGSREDGLAWMGSV